MGVCKPDSLATFSPYEVMHAERRIMGTFIANGSVPLAIEELAKGFIRTDLFVTHKIPLREIGRAVDLNRSGESVKTLVIPDGR
jgi:Zn-dependent alcohol dehydrogenase